MNAWNGNVLRANASMAAQNEGVPSAPRPVGGQSQPRAQALGVPLLLAREFRTASEFAVLASTLVVSAIFFGDWLEGQFQSFVWASALWLAVYAALMALERPSSIHGQLDLLASRLGNWLKASAFLIVVAFLAKGSFEVSRLWIGTVAIAGCVALGVLVWVADRLAAVMHRSGSFGDRLAIYGTGGRIEHLVRMLRDKEQSYQIDSIFADHNGVPAIEGVNLGADLDELIERAKAGHIDTILLNLPWSDQAVIEEVVTRLEEVNVDVLLAPSELQMARRSLQVARCGPFATLALYQRPIQGIGALIKVVLDRSLAAFALIFFAPLLLIIALAIRIESPGPVFFRQARRGLNNRPFNLYKFRSMYQEATDANADRLVSRGDSRVTRLGAFLRKSSLDELPQLFNILRGEMSLVGPRPHAYGAKAADRLYEEVVSRYPARHRVLPGLTGLAQVRGFRGGTDTEQSIINRINSDLEYIERWSMSLDLVILVRTVITVLFHRHAY